MSETIYALYPVFVGSDDLRDVLDDTDDRRDAAQEIENLYKSWEGPVEVRGTYSTVGFRADADLMLWLARRFARRCCSASLVEFRRTDGGPPDRTDVDVHGRREAGGVHAPTTLPRSCKGDAAGEVPVRVPVRAHARVVPAARARSAARCSASTAVIGREFPEVLGEHHQRVRTGRLGVDPRVRGRRADSLVDCIRRLREAKARLYTKVEIPFVTGIRKSVADVLDDLV